MFSIIWSRTGIKSIVMLKPNEKFNKEFFINKVFETIFWSGST